MKAKTTKEPGFVAMWEKWDGTVGGVGPFNMSAVRTIAEALFRRTSTSQSAKVAFRNAVDRAMKVMEDWCASEGTLLSE